MDFYFEQSLFFEPLLNFSGIWNNDVSNNSVYFSSYLTENYLENFNVGVLDYFYQRSSEKLVNNNLFFNSFDFNVFLKDRRFLSIYSQKSFKLLHLTDSNVPLFSLKNNLIRSFHDEFDFFKLVEFNFLNFKLSREFEAILDFTSDPFVLVNFLFNVKSKLFVPYLYSVKEGLPLFFLNDLLLNSLGCSFNKLVLNNFLDSNFILSGLKYHSFEYLNTLNGVEEVWVDERINLNFNSKVGLYWTDLYWKDFFKHFKFIHFGWLHFPKFYFVPNPKYIMPDIHTLPGRKLKILVLDFQPRLPFKDIFHIFFPYFYKFKSSEIFLETKMTFSEMPKSLNVGGLVSFKSILGNYFKYDFIFYSLPEIYFYKYQAEKMSFIFSFFLFISYFIFVAFILLGHVIFSTKNKFQWFYWPLVWFFSLFFLRFIFFILKSNSILSRNVDPITDVFYKVNYKYFLRARSAAKFLSIFESLNLYDVELELSRDFLPEADDYSDSNSTYYNFVSSDWEDNNSYEKEYSIFSSFFNTTLNFFFNTNYMRFIPKRFGLVNEQLIFSYLIVYLFYRLFYTFIYFLPKEIASPLQKFEQSLCDVIIRLEKSAKVRKKLSAFFLLAKLSSFLLTQLNFYKKSRGFFFLYIIKVFKFSIKAWFYFFYFVFLKIFFIIRNLFFIFHFFLQNFFLKNYFSFKCWFLVRLAWLNLRTLLGWSSSVRSDVYSPFSVREDDDLEDLLEIDQYHVAISEWLEAESEELFYESTTFKDWLSSYRHKSWLKEEKFLKFLAGFPKKNHWFRVWKTARFVDSENRWPDFTFSPEFLEITLFLRDYKGSLLPQRHPLYDKGVTSEKMIQDLLKADFLAPFSNIVGNSFWYPFKFSSFDFLSFPIEVNWSNFLNRFSFSKKKYFFFSLFFYKILTYILEVFSLLFYFFILLFSNFVKFLNSFFVYKFILFIFKEIGGLKFNYSFFYELVGKFFIMFYFLYEKIFKRFNFFSFKQTILNYTYFFFYFIINFFFRLISKTLSFFFNIRFLFLIFSLIFLGSINFFGFSFVLLQDLIFYLKESVIMDVNSRTIFEFFFSGFSINLNNFLAILPSYQLHWSPVPSFKQNLLELLILDYEFFFDSWGKFFVSNFWELPKSLLICFRWDWLPLPVILVFSGIPFYVIIFWLFHYYLVICFMFYVALVDPIVEFVLTYWDLYFSLFSYLVSIFQVISSYCINVDLFLVNLMSSDLSDFLSLVFFLGSLDFAVQDLIYFWTVLQEFFESFDETSFFMWGRFWLAHKSSFIYHYYFFTNVDSTWFFSPFQILGVLFNKFTLEWVSPTQIAKYGARSYGEDFFIFILSWLNSFSNFFFDQIGFSLDNYGEEFLGIKSNISSIRSGALAEFVAEIAPVKLHFAYSAFDTSYSFNHFFLAKYIDFWYLTIKESSSLMFPFSIFKIVLFDVFYCFIIFFLSKLLFPSAFSFFFFKGDNVLNNPIHNMRYLSNLKGIEVEWLFKKVVFKSTFYNFLRKFYLPNFSKRDFGFRFFYLSNKKRFMTLSSLIYSDKFLDLTFLKNTNHPLVKKIVIEFLSYMKEVNPEFAVQFSAFDGDAFEHLGNEDELNRIILPGFKLTTDEQEIRDTQWFSELASVTDLDSFFLEALPRPDSTGFINDLPLFRPSFGTRDDFEDDWFIDEEIRIDDKHFSTFIDFEDKVWFNLNSFFSSVDLNFFNNKLSSSSLHKDHHLGSYTSDFFTRDFFRVNFNMGRNSWIWFFFLSILVSHSFFSYFELTDIEFAHFVLYVGDFLWYKTLFLINSYLNWFFGIAHINLHVFTVSFFTSFDLDTPFGYQRFGFVHYFENELMYKFYNFLFKNF